jgi:hypothetical protein
MTRRIEQVAQVVEGGVEAIRFDPTNRGLWDTRRPRELALSQAGPMAGMSQDIGCSHSVLILPP